MNTTTNPKVSVRQASGEDAAGIAHLGRTTFSETFGHLFRDHERDLANYLATTFSVAKIRGSLGEADNFYWLAFLGDRPIGYAKLKYPSASELVPSRTAAQLQKIYLLMHFLGQGIGVPLLQAALARAAALGAPTVWLAVLRQNEPAIQFYRKFGFDRVGPHQFVIGAQTFDFDILSRKTHGNGETT